MTDTEVVRILNYQARAAQIHLKYRPDRSFAKSGSHACEFADYSLGLGRRGPWMPRHGAGAVIGSLGFRV